MAQLLILCREGMEDKDDYVERMDEADKFDDPVEDNHVGMIDEDEDIDEDDGSGDE